MCITLRLGRGIHEVYLMYFIHVGLYNNLNFLRFR
jgi:hypothetical protein